MKEGNGHGSQLAAWFNIAACGAIVVFGILMGINQSPFGFLLAIGAIGMEIVFVGILLAIRREQVEVRAGTFEPPSAAE